jgi:hypothetical protein
MKNEANCYAMGTMMDHGAADATSVENEDAKVTLDSMGEDEIYKGMLFISKNGGTTNRLMPWARL